METCGDTKAEIALLKTRLAAQTRMVTGLQDLHGAAITGDGEVVTDPALRWNRRAMIAQALLAAAGVSALGTGLAQVGAVPPVDQTPPPPPGQPNPFANGLEKPVVGNGAPGPREKSQANITAPKPNTSPADTTQTETYSGTAFAPASSTDTYSYYSAGSIYRTAGSGAFDCPLTLPVGAVITGAFFAFVKGSATNSQFVINYSYPFGGTILSLLSADTSAYSASINVQFLFVTASPPVTVVDYDSYYFRWAPGTNDSTSVLYGASVLYTYPNNAFGQSGALNGVGVAGTATGTGGIGVRGESAAGTGVYGIIPGGTASGTLAISGSNNATAANSHGIVGVATVGHGLVGTTNFVGAGPPYYAGLVGNATHGANAGNFYGNVAITGTLNGHGAIIEHSQVAVAHPDGTHRLAQPVVSPDGWIEDVGTGKLVVGSKAAITIDPAFAALADLGDYHVFLTEYDGHHALYVSDRTASGFTVHAAPAPQATSGGAVGTALTTATFSWRVMAKRKGGQAARLATYTFPNLEPPHIPDPPQKP